MSLETRTPCLNATTAGLREDGQLAQLNRNGAAHFHVILHAQGTAAQRDRTHSLRHCRACSLARAKGTSQQRMLSLSGKPQRTRALQGCPRPKGWSPRSRCRSVEAFCRASAVTVTKLDDGPDKSSSRLGCTALGVQTGPTAVRDNVTVTLPVAQLEPPRHKKPQLTRAQAGHPALP